MQRHLSGLLLASITFVLILSLFSTAYFPIVEARETSPIDAVGSAINWPEFWKVFRTYAVWNLEWLDGTTWRSALSDLTINITYLKPNHCKISIVFDASHYADYRLTFAINRIVRDYIERIDNFQYELTYDDVVITFDWSDCSSINGLMFTHGIRDDAFWFRIRRNNVPSGSHIVIDPSIIASSSSRFATSYPNQRKTFYAYSKHWVFFSNGTHAVYYYSSDGITWTIGNDSPLRSATYGYMFSIWFTGDETGSNINFGYAYSSGALSAPLLFRRGTLYSNSSISWDASEQTVISGSSAFYYAYPFVCFGSDRYPWIGYRRYEKTVATLPFVIRCSSLSGAWATPSGFPYQLSTWTSTSWIVTISPLTNTQYSGAKAVFYSNVSSKINCQFWSAVAWSSEARSSSSIYGYGAWALSTSAIGNITHIVFLSSLNNKKYTYYNFTSNTFASETTIGIGTAVDNLPVISVNSTSNDIWLMWSDSPSSVSQFYYKLFNSSTSSWESEVNYFNETIIIMHDSVISPLRFSGRLGIAYMNGTSAYTVNFVFVELITIIEAWNSVSSWPFTLTGRAWSQIGFWPFTLLAEAWNMVSSWILSLPSEAWSLVASWSFDLRSRIWNPISSWIFSLNARSWQNINFWIFTLRSPGWNSISSWIFNLETLGWHSVSFWIFSLTPFSTGFLLIPLIFLVGVVLFLIAVALGKKFQNEF